MIHEKSRRTNAKKGMAMLAAAALLFGFGLVGCGGDDDDGTTPAPAPVPVSLDGLWELDGETMTISGSSWTASTGKGTFTKTSETTGTLVMTHAKGKPADEWKTAEEQNVPEKERAGTATLSGNKLSVKFGDLPTTVWTKKG